MYDVIIIGARVAGASTAMLAARAGLKVLFIDRHKFPSDTISTNYIHQSGCSLLAEWGLLEQIKQSGSPPINRTRIAIDDVLLEGSVSDFRQQRLAYAPRRYVLDQILIDAAVVSGAELREKCHLQEVLRENDNVIGVKLKNADGTSSVEYCRLLIGADGMRSSVVAQLDIPFVRRDPTLTCAYYSFWQGVERGYELYESNNRWMGVIPTNNNTILIVTYFPQDEFNLVRAAPLEAHKETIKTLSPGLFNELDNATQVEKLWGTGEQWNYFRQATGNNWALVGDAAIHKDSLTALGITDAMHHAALLAQHVFPALTKSDSIDLQYELQSYEKAIVDHTTPGYLDTLGLATSGERQNRKTFVRAVLAKPWCIPLYFDAVAGLCNQQELINAMMGINQELTPQNELVEMEI